MSSIFAVNENNDIYATSTNRLAIASDLEAVLQSCEHAVKTVFTEVYYDRTRGVDYFGNVFSSNPNLLAFEADVRRTLASVAGVRSIPQFTYEVNSSTLSYEAVIQTIYGTGTISGDIDGLI